MIAVIIPTLNEEKAIKEVLNDFPDECCGEEVKLYVIDGGSKDSTVEIAEENGAEVIYQRLTGGKGDAIREAIEKIDSEYYVTIDGDGTYDPEELEKIVRPMVDKEADHVIGRRITKEPGAIPLLNRGGNKLFNIFATFFTGKSIKDMLSGYRGFTRESLHNTAFTRPGFGIETEMTLTAVENNIAVKEVPISYTKRKGNSKLNPISDGFKILKTLAWSIRDISPLKFFTASSLFLLLLSVYPSYLVIHQKLATGRIQDLGPAIFAGFLIIIAVQLLIFGLLADQIKNVENRLRSRI